MTINIVVLGGGTGTFTVLSGLKRVAGVRLTAVVSIADNGGSSGRLRVEHGVLPPGDILQCLVALSAFDEDLRLLFTHRFDRGRQDGDTLGNLVLTAAQERFGDVLSATRTVQRLLNVHGEVIPVSRRGTQLFAVLADGTFVEGEDAVDHATEARAAISDCYLDPAVEACDEACRAVRAADILVFGPGDLYTSTVPVVLAGGMREAIASSRAKRFYVMNLMTRRGQTDAFAASDFVREAERYVGSPFDRVFLNDAPIPADVVERYALAEEHPVRDDLRPDSRCVRGDLLSAHIREAVPGDVVRRSLVRHDPHKLARALLATLP